MTFDLTTFGEAMVRLSVRPGECVETATRIDFFTGGSEANTAATMARMGMKSAWASRLTDNPLGRRVAADVARHGVDVSGVVWTNEDRVGSYFVEMAARPAASTVTYDRAGSAFAKLSPRDLDWDGLLDTRVLHLTGITPALGPGCLQAVASARKRAARAGVPISLDVNYRARLWTEGEAAKALIPLLKGVEILIMTAEDAVRVFRIEGEPEQMLHEIRRRFGCRIAVLTMGGQGAATWDGRHFWSEPGFDQVDVIDRVGAGDAFTAGLLCGWLDGDLALGLRYGIITSALKMGMRGDHFVGDRKAVDRLAANRDGRGGGISR